MRCDKPMTTKFPFLLGRAFIEALENFTAHNSAQYFPSFSEGLSLRTESAGEGSSGGNMSPFLNGFLTETFVEERCHGPKLVEWPCLLTDSWGLAIGQINIPRMTAGPFVLYLEV